MPRRSPDLHGNAPDEHATVLLLIDTINDFEWPGAESAYPAALKMARRIAALKKRATRAGVPCLYVNDNFGKWRSNFDAQVQHGLRSRGRAIVEALLPAEDDYFVLKPKNS